MDSPVESLLVGRAALLTSLCRQVDAAAAGRGGLVLLAGEPGIGKTALAAEVLSYARSRGVTAAWGNCEDGGTAPGLWPWQQILRAVTGRPEPLGGGDGARARVGGEDARTALFEGIAERLLEGGEPLVAVLDDLQWADTASVLLLARLGRRAGHEPLLLLGTYRDVELAPDHPLLSLTDADVVVLGGLAPADVAVLLDRFGEQAGPETAAAVQRRTGGNPFFVQQLARLRAAGGDSGAVPVAVGQTVARRLARLPDGTARLLGTAAVLGRGFGIVPLATVAAVPSTEVPVLLEPALEARSVARDGPDGYRFVHDLFREELMAELDPGTDGGRPARRPSCRGARRGARRTGAGAGRRPGAGPGTGPGARPAGGGHRTGRRRSPCPRHRAVRPARRGVGAGHGRAPGGARRRDGDGRGRR
ncbi:ATP-binding protein [Streptomyces sp. NPDC101160]|uniref:ATP-binding protein n=1 Tax=Streptomyces sp. NPDC101160 TaxID=3366118 RepID=UPI00380541F2